MSHFTPMNLDRRLIEILCCPATRQPVALLSAAQLDALNRAVDTGQLVSVDGSPVRQRFSAGLVTRDARTVYRVEDGIPVMLVDQGVSLTQIERFPA